MPTDDDLRLYMSTFSDTPLIDILEHTLREKGYIQNGADPDYWSPSNSSWTDKLIPTLVACLAKEALGPGDHHDPAED